MNKYETRDKPKMKRLLIQFISGFVVLAIGGVFLGIGFNNADATHRNKPNCVGQNQHDCLFATTATVLAVQEASGKQSGAHLTLRLNDNTTTNIYISTEGNKVAIGDKLPIQILDNAIVSVQVKGNMVYTNKEPSMPLVITGIAIMVTGFVLIAIALPGVYTERQRKLAILIKGKS